MTADVLRAKAEFSSFVESESMQVFRSKPTLRSTVFLFTCTSYGNNNNINYFAY